MNPPIFFDKRTGLYFYGEDPVCQNCKQHIDGEVALFLIFHPVRKQSYGSLWCHDCFQFAKYHCENAIYGSERFDIQVNQDIPNTAYFYPILRMGTVNSNITVFDHAISDAGIKSDTSSCEVNDQTKLAGKESWDGASIGKSESQVDLECGDKNKMLSNDEVDDLLIDMFTATPASQLEHKENVRIEASQLPPGTVVGDAQARTISSLGSGTPPGNYNHTEECK